MIERQEKPRYTVYCCSVPLVGQMVPMLKVCSALHKRGHQIILSTSSYEVPKTKENYPQFQFVELNDTANKTDFNNKKSTGPPLHLYYQQWKQDIRQSLIRTKPDIILADMFSLALIQIAEELQINLVINCVMSLKSLITFGIPNFTSNFGFLGFTVIKPNLSSYIVLKQNDLIKKMGHMFSKHLCIVHSFFGLDQPISIPPNIKMIGLCVEKNKIQPIPEDIKRWLKMVKQRDLKIIYVTFGSLLTASQQFINYLYYGLKKTGMAVLWSLKENNLPEENQLFMVKPWLPQKELLKQESVKIVITHCGFGGVTEIIDAEKPILAMPVFGDQPQNAQMIQQKGIGIILRKSASRFSIRKYQTFGYTHEELITKVNLLLCDPNYELRIKKLKRIGLQCGGVEYACDIIEESIENGTDHLIDKNMINVAQRNPFGLLKVAVLGVLVVGVSFLGLKYKDEIL